ncbi:hypothetical protein E2C01_031187 [Portunus trituberculatus]|uniref:Uncharacterized protein n=1 Tax=Portunus trituberculatus TaxID=210409 RepID=A0A5B7EX01_PORTR|nr:hypothetical protein [Portunus trituberculatus]
MGGVDCTSLAALTQPPPPQPSATPILPVHCCLLAIPLTYTQHSTLQPRLSAVGVENARQWQRHTRAGLAVSGITGTHVYSLVQIPGLAIIVTCLMMML